MKTGPKPIPQDEARVEANAAGLEPNEPYPGRTTDPWSHRCVECGDDDVRRSLARIRQGAGCTHRRAAWAQERLQIIADAGFDLVGPAPKSVVEDVEVRCRVCEEVSVRAMHWLKNNTCPCVSYAGYVDEMRHAGYEPKGPYPGDARSPWPSVCKICHQDRRVSLSTVRSGKRCKHGDSWVK